MGVGVGGRGCNLILSKLTSRFGAVTDALNRGSITNRPSEFGGKKIYNTGIFGNTGLVLERSLHWKFKVNFKLKLQN